MAKKKDFEEQLNFIVHEHLEYMITTNLHILINFILQMQPKVYQHKMLM